jgi:hypothetical protein
MSDSLPVSVASPRSPGAAGARDVAAASYTSGTGMPSTERGAVPAPRVADWRLLLLGVLAASALYVAWHLNRGWIPHDEGALAQSAERLLQGELPHRDFDDVYTGGLAYLNAGAFRLFGTTLLTMRLVLFALFVAWVPAVFYVASRLVRPVAAAGLTLLCVVWTLPNYPAPMPSWYNLFLAMLGLAALVRWLEDRRPRWLAAAGVAGGLSVLVKVVGLYFIAGVLLFLVFEAHARSRAVGGPEARRGWAYALFTTICLLGFCAALVLVVHRQLYAAELVHLLLPGMLVAGLLIRNEWIEPAGGSRARFMTLARLLAPFIAGVALPVAIFLVPYVRANALAALVNGLFVLPVKRLDEASYRMLSLWSVLAVVPAWLLHAYGRRLAGRATRHHLIGLAAVLAALLVASGRVPLVYRSVWYGARNALPLLVLIGVVVMARVRPADAASPLRRSRTMLLLSASALLTLVQFPFPAPIYFCYIAPLVVLLAAALLPYSRPVTPVVPAALVVFLIAFAVLRTNTSALLGMGVLYRAYPETTSLGLPRGNLDVRVEDAAMYDRALAVLLRHARGGYTWASPDSPEVYFLSGLKNPTRTLFDFFDDDTERTPRILSTLERHGVTAVVLNAVPQFSDQVPEELRHALEARYPSAMNIGRFQIRWQ